MSSLLTVVALAQPDPVPAKDQVGPGVAYLALFVLLLAVVIFLWFSLRKQLRRIHLPEDEAGEQVTPPGRPGSRPEA